MDDICSKKATVEAYKLHQQFMYIKMKYKRSFETNNFHHQV